MIKPQIPFRTMLCLLIPVTLNAAAETELLVTVYKYWKYENLGLLQIYNLIAILPPTIITPKHLYCSAKTTMSKIATISITKQNKNKHLALGNEQPSILIFYNSPIRIYLFLCYFTIRINYFMDKKKLKLSCLG